MTDQEIILSALENPGSALQTTAKDALARLVYSNKALAVQAAQRNDLVTRLDWYIVNFSRLEAENLTLKKSSRLPTMREIVTAGEAR